MGRRDGTGWLDNAEATGLPTLPRRDRLLRSDVWNA